jgi:hypothetical protein
VDGTGSSLMRYRRPQGLLAGLRDEIDRPSMVIRSPFDPTLSRHAGNGVFARRVQFLNGEPFSRTHPLQGASFDRMRNMAWAALAFLSPKTAAGHAATGNRFPMLVGTRSG